MHVSLSKSLFNAREITQEKIGTVLASVLSVLCRKIVTIIGTEEVKFFHIFFLVTENVEILS